MNLQQQIAAIDAGVLALFIPIFAILTGGVIAITAMMMKHQREMAEKMSTGQQLGNTEMIDEVRALRGEVAQMREIQAQTMIALDTNSSPQRTSDPGVPSDIEDRLQQN
jgi:hypothetical protein